MFKLSTSDMGRATSFLECALGVSLLLAIAEKGVQIRIYEEYEYPNVNLGPVCGKF